MSEILKNTLIAEPYLIGKDGNTDVCPGRQTFSRCHHGDGVSW